MKWPCRDKKEELAQEADMSTISSCFCLDLIHVRAGLHKRRKRSRKGSRNRKKILI